MHRYKLDYADELTYYLDEFDTIQDFKDLVKLDHIELKKVSGVWELHSRDLGRYRIEPMYRSKDLQQLIDEDAEVTFIELEWGEEV